MTCELPVAAGVFAMLREPLSPGTHSGLLAADSLASTAAQASTFAVQVPLNCMPGAILQVTTPRGVLVNVAVPSGVPPGSSFLCAEAPVQHAAAALQVLDPRDRLVSFYTSIGQPDKDIDALLSRFNGREAGLFAMITRKYGYAALTASDHAITNSFTPLVHSAGTSAATISPVKQHPGLAASDDSDRAIITNPADFMMPSQSTCSGGTSTISPVQHHPVDNARGASRSAVEQQILRENKARHAQAEADGAWAYSKCADVWARVGWSFMALLLPFGSIFSLLAMQADARPLPGNAILTHVIAHVAFHSISQSLLCLPCLCCGVCFNCCLGWFAMKTIYKDEADASRSCRRCNVASKASAIVHFEPAPPEDVPRNCWVRLWAKCCGPCEEFSVMHLPTILEPKRCYNCCGACIPDTAFKANKGTAVFLHELKLITVLLIWMLLLVVVPMQELFKTINYNVAAKAPSGATAEWAATDELPNVGFSDRFKNVYHEMITLFGVKTSPFPAILLRIWLPKPVFDKVYLHLDPFDADEFDWLTSVTIMQLACLWALFTLGAIAIFMRQRRTDDRVSSLMKQAPADYTVVLRGIPTTWTAEHLAQTIGGEVCEVQLHRSLDNNAAIECTKLREFVARAQSSGVPVDTVSDVQGAPCQDNETVRMVCFMKRVLSQQDSNAANVRADRDAATAVHAKLNKAKAKAQGTEPCPVAFASFKTQEGKQAFISTTTRQHGFASKVSHFLCRTKPTYIWQPSETESITINQPSNPERLIWEQVTRAKCPCALRAIAVTIPLLIHGFVKVIWTALAVYTSIWSNQQKEALLNGELFGQDARTASTPGQKAADLVVAFPITILLSFLPLYFMLNQGIADILFRALCLPKILGLIHADNHDEQGIFELILRSSIEFLESFMTLVGGALYFGTMISHQDPVCPSSGFEYCNYAIHPTRGSCGVNCLNTFTPNPQAVDGVSCQLQTGNSLANCLQEYQMLHNHTAQTCFDAGLCNGTLAFPPTTTGVVSCSMTCSHNVVQGFFKLVSRERRREHQNDSR